MEPEDTLKPAIDALTQQINYCELRMKALNLQIQNLAQEWDKLDQRQSGLIAAKELLMRGPQ